MRAARHYREAVAWLVSVSSVAVLAHAVVGGIH